MPSPAERIELLETMLAALIDHLDAVGCYDAQGERLSDQVPVVRQARIVWGMPLGGGSSALARNDTA